MAATKNDPAPDCRGEQSDTTPLSESEREEVERYVEVMRILVEKYDIGRLAESGDPYTDTIARFERRLLRIAKRAIANRAKRDPSYDEYSLIGELAFDDAARGINVGEADLQRVRHHKPWPPVFALDTRNDVIVLACHLAEKWLDDRDDIEAFRYMLWNAWFARKLTSGDARGELQVDCEELGGGEPELVLLVRGPEGEPIEAPALVVFCDALNEVTRGTDRSRRRNRTRAQRLISKMVGLSERQVRDVVLARAPKVPGPRPLPSRPSPRGPGSRR